MRNYLWNMFANIKTGQLAKRNFIFHPRKKTCEYYLNLLWKEGFITGYTIDSKSKNQIKIFLKYRNGRPVINSLTLISKPSRRIYYSIKQIYKINYNKSFIVFSTNKGLKSITECKKLRIGGEPVLIIN